MPMGPKDVEEKIERMLNAWETLAPDKIFGGLGLTQFRALAQVSLDARDRIDELEDQLKQAKVARDEADEVFLERADLVTNGVRADPTERPDSALYAAFGYKRKSERRNGLTRKRTPTE